VERNDPFRSSWNSRVLSAVEVSLLWKRHPATPPTKWASFALCEASRTWQRAPEGSNVCECASVQPGSRKRAYDPPVRQHAALDVRVREVVTKARKITLVPD